MLERRSFRKTSATVGFSPFFTYLLTFHYDLRKLHVEDYAILLLIWFLTLNDTLDTNDTIISKKNHQALAPKIIS